MTSYWNKKSCLVTGGSSGLGRAIATALISRGADVAINGRRADALEQTAAQLRAKYVSSALKVVVLPGDVTHQEDVDRLASLVKEQFGRLDLLCHCAGRSTRAAVLDTTPEEFQELWELNFLAAVRVTRAFAPQVIGSRGHVIHIGSLASKVAPRYMGAYPASKFALAAYAQQLRLELGPEGVHVLLVCPGPIRREEKGERYAAEARGVPAGAQAPGAGAHLSALDPDWLAEKILDAAEARKPELVLPRKARLLFTLAALSPQLGDWLLRRSTS